MVEIFKTNVEKKNEPMFLNDKDVNEIREHLVSANDQTVKKAA